MSDAEAIAAYDCLLKEMQVAYAKSDDDVALNYAGWRSYSAQPYISGTHGNRYVQNYANDTAKAYGAFEKAGRMPEGSKIAKDSFSVGANGKVMVGPLFVMEKMSAGFHPASDDWRYTMVMPNGSIFGTTHGAGSAKVQFCAECHMSVTPDADSLMFLPDEYRVSR